MWISLISLNSQWVPLEWATAGNSKEGDKEFGELHYLETDKTDTHWSFSWNFVIMIIFFIVNSTPFHFKASFFLLHLHSSLIYHLLAIQFRSFKFSISYNCWTANKGNECISFHFIIVIFYWIYRPLNSQWLWTAYISTAGSNKMKENKRYKCRTDNSTHKKVAEVLKVILKPWAKSKARFLKTSGITEGWEPYGCLGDVCLYSKD